MKETAKLASGETKMKLTPIESIIHENNQHGYKVSGRSALVELIERAEESQLQIDYYNENFADGGCPDEKMIVLEAIKDLNACQDAIELIMKRLDLNIDA